ncbi:uncharacterized protein LOC134237878, partial [Saccostrea cucullata]|uniref:uncharacterized protein LOC134237878 n=1 Tax=Saccostrea cuccullata TaxID=36930 RepID=UPI002ECFAECD
MRRDVADFRDMMEKSPLLDIPTIQMTTGSRREGFQFMGSDTDVMIWSEDVKVIWDMKQAFNYDKGKHTLILSYSSESPPGYTLLVLMECVYRACISMTTIPFISSSTLRRKLFSDILPDFTEHGPCSRGYMNRMEYDVAQCFACDIWPPSASQWIARSHDWPGSQLVNEIVKGGCHFVPIGHKQGNFEFDEWRISFSLAEQKLVYSMNHCQFLTYGLLKLFLKEVINDGLSTEDKLLCSYHMKTAVLWVLQQNTIRDWRPQNLLEGFRVCFKFILKCVYEGVCPNFFIPENNMFLSNIHGKAQNDLFTRLYALYERGLASLLDSSFIRPYLFQELNNHGQNTCTDEPILISEIVTTFQELGI